MTWCQPTTSHDTAVPPGSSKSEDGVSRGRKVCCGCCTSKIIFTIATVVGLVLLLVGILGLAGYCYPTSSEGIASPILQKLHAILIDLSESCGTDPLILTAFPTAFGLASTFTGIVGLILQKETQVSTNPKETQVSTNPKETQVSTNPFDQID